MRDYTKISPFFWINDQGKVMRQYGKETQFLSLYLLSCPHSTMLGIYYLPIPFIAHETGIKAAKVKQCLKNLSEIQFCVYDERSEYVWVIDMAGMQVGEELKKGDNRVKHIEEAYQNLPKLPFLKDFYDKYHQQFHLTNPRENFLPSEAPSKPLQDPSLAHSNPTIFVSRRNFSSELSLHDNSVSLLSTSTPLQSPLEAPSEPLQSQDQEQEQKQEQDQYVKTIKHMSSEMNDEKSSVPSVKSSAAISNPLQADSTKLTNATVLPFSTSLNENKSVVSNKLKPPDNNHITEIFECWKKTFKHENAILDEKRKMCIRIALKWGYTSVQLCEAITGCSRTPYNMGENDSGQQFDGLHVIFKNADNIERFIRNAHSPPVRHLRSEHKSESYSKHLTPWRDPHEDFENKKYTDTPIEDIAWLRKK